MTDASDEPIVPNEGSTPFSAKVIDLDGIRVRWGRVNKACEHRSLVYSVSDRRVWCDDCQRTIDNFDAFYVLTKNFHGMVGAAEANHHRASEAMRATLVRRAAKALDRTWGHKMAAACPHCRAGLLPEDFAGGVASSTSREIEIARRKRMHQEPKP